MAKHYALGWQPDLPDFRDYTPDTEIVEKELHDTVALKKRSTRGKKKNDLSEYFPDVENQGQIGSCTAQAGVGLLEYFERRKFGRHIDASRMFLYKATRNLQGWQGDSGGLLRTTMKAMVLFGCPPERFMPYAEPDFDAEPSAFCYAFAQNYRAIKYFRLDTQDVARQALLDRIKQFIDAEYPPMFGFSVYNTGNDKGELAFPNETAVLLGGHAVIAVGYDDERKIGGGARKVGGKIKKVPPDKGALKIRNSWGPEWGEGGYGWLPYRYVLEGLTADFWSLFKAEHVDERDFE